MTSASPPGRAELLVKLAAEVERAHASQTRLAAALARGDAADRGRSLAAAFREASGGEIYAVAPHTFAVALPGKGRADALGILAKVEAASGARGAAIELERDETAAELFVRLLETAPGPVPPGSVPGGD